MSLPGTAKAQGLWPAAWTMGASPPLFLPSFSFSYSLIADHHRSLLLQEILRELDMARLHMVHGLTGMFCSPSISTRWLASRIWLLRA